MKKGMVTVVVPIYNVEKYLNRCIKSVVAQSYKDLEIILVDDESPDRCPEICEEWRKKDTRIKVIHKKNGGLGYARNTGIDNANGEYICFLDSDDYIALDAIEKCYKCAVENNADIVSFGYSRVNQNDGIIDSLIPQPSKYIFEGKEIQEILLPDMIAPDTRTGKVTNLWMSMCGALFSMELIGKSNWRMVSERNIISEDVYSLLKLYKNVKKAVVIPETFYFYCENFSSLTHTYKQDRFEKIKDFYIECQKVCDEFDYADVVRERLKYPFLSNTIAAMKMIIMSDQNRQQKEKLFHDIIDDVLLQQILHEIPLIKERRNRRLLLNFMKLKMYTSCYFLIRIKIKGRKK